MIHVVLIAAGPTPWEQEDRLVGGHSLPLAESARASITQLAAATAAVQAIYTDRNNEACEQAAAILARQFKLRIRNRPDLAELRLGLWEGLTRGELGVRFPTVFDRWQEQPLTVIPPEGETLEDAIGRLHEVLRLILRRHRDSALAMILRPMAMQIVLGLLRREDPATIGIHLHKTDPVATMDVEESVLRH